MPDTGPRALIARRAWLVFGGASVAAATLYLLLPTGGVTQAMLAEGLTVAAAAMLVVRLARDGLLSSALWRNLAISVGLYAGVSPLWGIVPAVTGGPPPFITAIETVYLVAYGFAAAFLLGLIRRRHVGARGVRRPEVVALVDGSIFAVAATAALWPVMVGPAETIASADRVTFGFAVSFLLLTALLAGLAVRLLTADVRTSAVHWLVLAWIGFELAGDVYYAYLATIGAFTPGHPVTVAWIVSFVAVGVLALHPALPRLAEGDPEFRLGGWRLWLPLLAVLVPLVSAVIVANTFIYVLAVGAILLNVVRLRLLSVDLAAQRRMADELASTVGELERANESLERFAAVASHDLRGPLASIHTLLDTVLVRGRSLEPGDRSLVDRALRRTGQLLATTDAILALSRAEAVGIIRDRVALGPLLDEIVVSLAHELEEADGRVDRDELPTVVGDEALLRVLLLNLLTNAIKYREPTRPLEVTVGAQRDGDTWLVTVEDNGQGIDTDDVERIFAMFTRASSADQVAGTGIGLATCRQIAEQHGGKIDVAARPTGARFVVTLPA